MTSKLLNEKNGQWYHLTVAGDLEQIYLSCICKITL